MTKKYYDITTIQDIKTINNIKQYVNIQRNFNKEQKISPRRNAMDADLDLNGNKLTAEVSEQNFKQPLQ